jgi:uncharacterized protein YfaA (DUF2138 family)
MRAAYEAYAAREGVIPVPDDFDAEALIAQRGLEAAARTYGPALAAIAAVLVALAGFGVVVARRRRRA